MSLVEQSVVAAITIKEGGIIEVRREDRVLRDGDIISVALHRHVVSPGDDITAEDEKVQAAARAAWTPAEVAPLTDQQRAALAELKAARAALATEQAHPENTINGVPQAVDMVKAEVYFIRVGVLEPIKAAVAGAGAEAQAIWARSKTIQRQNPLMLHIAHNVLQWTDAQIDAHFIAAEAVVI